MVKGMEEEAIERLGARQIRTWCASGLGAPTTTWPEKSCTQCITKSEQKSQNVQKGNSSSHCMHEAQQKHRAKNI